MVPGDEAGCRFGHAVEHYFPAIRRWASAALKTPARVVGATPHRPSELPGFLIQSSRAAGSAVERLPSLRPLGLHHCPLAPLPLRLVSTTYPADRCRAALTCSAYRRDSAVP